VSSALADFDPLSVPLAGIRLVEASAGTGKTWSIVSLMLRAVALEGRRIDSILLVTFTEAATRELRQRLRLRLEEVQRCLGGQEVGDEFLDALRAEAARRELSEPQLEQRIVDALVQLDEAWVHTIHGLCARWLGEFAFAQQRGLQPWPAEDAREVQELAVADVWRQQVVLADPAQAMLLIGWFGNADTLFERLRPLLARDPWQIDGDGFEARYAECRIAEVDLLAQLQALLAEDAFVPFFDHLREPSRYNANRLNESRKQRAEAQLASISAGSDRRDIETLGKMTRSALEAIRNKGFTHAPIPDSSALRWIDSWTTLIAELAIIEPLVWLHRLLRAVREREGVLRSRRRSLSFDGLISGVRDQLLGTEGATLAAHIATRFPLAVVDEFQDTDAGQYTIFRAIYRQRVDAGLLLVGDPKQAIYRFRGGDIYAYRHALHDADARYSLRYNRRSQRAAVAAVNALFDGRERPFLVDFIPFNPVDVPASVPLADADAHGMVVWRLPDEFADLTVEQAEQRVIEAVAAEIAGLIEAGHAPLRAEPPIAVLVAAHRQASAVRRALARWGIACAYAGDGSVWASDAAHALLEAIDALASPRDPGRQRRVWLGPLFELDAAALLAASPERERAVDALTEARSRAARNDPVAALLPLIADAAARMLRRPEGQRWLIDALHVLDLISERWPQIEHLLGLAEWMQQCIAQARDSEAKPADAERLRSESDRARVRLSTVHASKGLQFDYVFAPFLWTHKQSNLKRPDQGLPKAVSWHDADGALRVDPGSPDWLAHAALDAQEAFAERLRLVYVALTRARYCSWTAYGGAGANATDPVEIGGSALRYLLATDDPNQSGIDASLARWRARATRALHVVPLPEAVSPRQVVMVEPTELPLARTLAGVSQGGRQIASYSGLFGDAGHRAGERPDHDAHLPVIVATLPSSGDLLDAPPEARGARFGECAHAVIEHIEPSRWPDQAGLDLLAATCRRFGFGEPTERYLQSCITSLCSAPLIDGLRLDATPTGDRIAELEFFFPLREADLKDFFGVLAREPRYARSALPARRVLQGYLRGFIDLVARWQGRYYVLDYKTNLLGTDADAYRPEALATAVRASNYDLQYLLYCLAVHRHLRARLGASYSYAEHFGGVCYIFLRGLDHTGTRGVFVDRPSAALIYALDQWAGTP